MKGDELLIKRAEKYRALECPKHHTQGRVIRNFGTGELRRFCMKCKKSTPLAESVWMDIVGAPKLFDVESK